MGRLIDETNLMNLLYALDDARYDLCYAIKKIPELPTVEAIPKDQYEQLFKNGFLKDCEVCEEHFKDIYEQRLKADLVAVLTELQLEIAELPAHVVSNMGSIIRMEIAPSAEDVYEVIQEKINSLKEVKDGSN